jgi:hypothetical protein
MDERSAYRFEPAMLAAPRRAGISAIMRIRNGADFLRLAIESHLPFYDEIVACYNDCSDATEDILRELAARHPGRVRPLHYRPKVHPPYGAAHDRTPTESVHSLANYYNWALSHARYATAVKLDDDHLAIPGPLARGVARIRAEQASGICRLYTFSGVNLVRGRGHSLAVYGNQPLVGTGDIMYFPVRPDIHFRQTRRFEYLAFTGKVPLKSYMGLLYFHLKHVKPDYGFGNLEPELRCQATREFLETLQVVGIDEFRGASYQQRLRRSHNRLEYGLRTNRVVERLVRALSGREPPLRISRLRRLAEDVAQIDWDRDLFAHLPDSTAAAPAGAGAGSGDARVGEGLVPSPA